MADIQDTLTERGSLYGSLASHAKTTCDLKQVMHATDNWIGELSDSQMRALDMIANKIGRILNGDPNYADSWVDIVGYAQLVVNELEAKV